MAKNTLTDVKIKSLKSDPKRRIEIWDAQVPGFGLRISPAGTKSFVLLYRLHGRSRRMTLGRYPQLTLGDARIQARDLTNSVAKGIDPQSQPEQEQSEKPISKVQVRAKYRLDSVVADFVVKHCQRKNRAQTAHETQRLLQAHFVSIWPARDVRTIGRADILGVLDSLVEAGKSPTANHAYAAVRKFFNWCVERGIVEASPCMGIKQPAKPGTRSRVLSRDELASIWRTVDKMDGPFVAISRLLALTGQRRNEVAAMRWEDLDFHENLWTIPPERNKSDRSHIVPLTGQMLAILHSVPRLSELFVFPSLRSATRTFSGFSKCKKRLDQLSGVSDWTLHDLRRTVATGLAQQGVPPHVVEKLLNHSTGTLGGVAGIYNRFQYLEEIRDALESWGEHIYALGQTSVAEAL